MTYDTYICPRTISDLQKSGENVGLLPFKKQPLVYDHFPQYNETVLELLLVLENTFCHQQSICRRGTLTDLRRV